MRVNNKTYRYHLLFVLITILAAGCSSQAQEPDMTTEVQGSIRLMEALEFSQECPHGCFLEIQPLVSTTAEAHHILQESPFIDQTSIRVHYNKTRKIDNHPGDDSALQIKGVDRLQASSSLTESEFLRVDISGANDIVDQLEVNPASISIQDFIALIGEPDKIQVIGEETPHGGYWIRYSLFYSKWKVLIEVFNSSIDGPMADDGVHAVILNKEVDEDDFKPWKGYGKMKEYMTGIQLVRYLTYGPDFDPEAEDPPDDVQEACEWYGTVHAWIDENGNGEWDENEQPLANVTMFVEDISGNNMEIGGGPGTNLRGDTVLVAWLPGCSSEDAEIYPEIPAGYVLTTPSRLKIDPQIGEKEYLFGFNYLPNIPTVTPVPPKRCQSFKLGKENEIILIDLAVSPNGTIWVSSLGNGVYKLLPGSTEWINYNQDDGIASNDVYSISVERDDSIWFATGEGASHFDGLEWRSYLPGNGFDQVVADNELIWFTSYTRLYIFDTDSETWKILATEDGPLDGKVYSIAIAQDDSIWLTTRAGVSRWIWPARPEGIPLVKHFPTNVTNIEIRPNKVWFGGSSGIKYIDLESGKLMDYTFYLTEAGFDDDVGAFAVGPDDSIWIGSPWNNALYHAIMDKGNDRISLRLYDSDDGLPEEYDLDESIYAIDIAPDNSAWICTRTHATRCLFP